jgi:hypothetical protein
VGEWREYSVGWSKKSILLLRLRLRLRLRSGLRQSGMGFGAGVCGLTEVRPFQTINTALPGAASVAGAGWGWVVGFALLFGGWGGLVDGNAAVEMDGFGYGVL